MKATLKPSKGWRVGELRRAIAGLSDSARIELRMNETPCDAYDVSLDGIYSSDHRPGQTRKIRPCLVFGVSILDRENGDGIR